MDKVQEHIEKVREAMRAVATTTGLMRYEASRFLGDHSEVWLEQSLDIIEQQQREIEKWQRQYKSVVQAINDCRNEPGMVFAAYVLDWIYSTAPIEEDTNG